MNPSNIDGRVPSGGRHDNDYAVAVHNDAIFRKVGNEPLIEICSYKSESKRVKAI